MEELNQTIYRENPDPNAHIAGAFLVPNLKPVESNWTGVIAGGLVLLLLVAMMSPKMKL